MAHFDGCPHKGDDPDFSKWGRLDGHNNGQPLGNGDRYRQSTPLDERWWQLHGAQLRRPWALVDTTRTILSALRFERQPPSFLAR